MVARLKSFMKNLKDNVAFFEASEKDLKNELPVSINVSTRLSQLADDIREKVVELREGLGARDGAIRSIV